MKSAKHLNEKIKKWRNTNTHKMSDYYYYIDVEIIRRI